MAKNKRDHMNIEDLAVMIKHGFDGVDKRFDEVDKRFEGVDKRFDAVDKRFDRVDKRIDNVEREISTLHADIQDIKGTLGPLARVVTAQEHEFHTLRMRVTRIETKIGIAK